MIAFVEGRLAEKTPSRAVIDVSGVGYDLAISLNTYEELPEKGGRARLLTVPYIREEKIQLYGFGTQEELDLFQVVLGVPGVGPKLALAILSAMRPEPFRRAVVEGDTAVLLRIPGIGKKSAERLVVELRSKFEPGGREEITALLRRGKGGAVEEALLALETLGFRNDQAARAVKKVLDMSGGETPSVEELVRKALTVV